MIDIDTGKVVATLPCVQGVDDLWFDGSRKRIYATGSGFIDIFQQLDADHYSSIARIDAGVGSGSTSYFIKGRTQKSPVHVYAKPAAAGRFGSPALLPQ